MPASVTVEVPARLHLGFLDLNGGLGRRFGSIGLAIDRLCTRVTIKPAAQTAVRGADRERAARCLAALQRALGIDGGFDLDVEQAVPAHAGLGSGTRMALATGAALRRLHGLALDVKHDAMRLGRGRRSGIGIALFERGGLVVDGGRGAAAAPAPVISRMRFPEAWRAVVVLDPSRQGMHGPPEDAAFAALVPQTAERAAQACRLVVMQALPALAEGDLAPFGAAIAELQSLVGDHFAPLQGGARFTSPRVAAAVEFLAREGGVGIGQSSWGPTGFAFAGSAAQADRLAETLRGDPRGAGLDILVCRGLNRGATITVQAASAT
jgi:beta-RFAP synthase